MENLNFFWVVSIGLHTKVLYLEGEGSRSNGVVCAQEFIKFPHFIKWPSLQHQGGYGIKDSSVYSLSLALPGAIEACAGSRGNGGIFDSTAAPAPAGSERLKLPHSRIKAK